MTDYRANRVHRGFLVDPDDLLENGFYSCIDIHKAYTRCVEIYPFKYVFVSAEDEFEQFNPKDDI